MNNGWHMTLEQAKACLRVAPADDQLSAVEPNMKRRDVVSNWTRILGKANIYVIDLTPSVSKSVAQVTQDCLDPVEMRFCYDPEGIIQVGWNREEVEMRKGLRPRPASTDDGLAGYAYRTDLEAYLQKERSAKAIDHSFYDEIDAAVARKLQQAKFEMLARQQQQALALDALNNLHTSPDLQMLAAQQQGILEKIQKARQEQIRNMALQASFLGTLPMAQPKPSAPPAPEPKPEPKPDPTSPKFVLKRPKL